ncbi:diaminopimelate epimerase [Haematomicrobium sanguinis]|uniref:diaminopimelate epimerase n=1 Tax=Haematomicrobium sanguinis TaxID=479106 RepID=UPI00068AB404|nr:diaminopimelate epimerase [Haematomicrobium sanguinis]
MSAPIPFLKGHGTGNDFILIPDADGELTISASQVREWTDRHKGIGADGVIRLVRTEKLRPEDASETVAAEIQATEWFMDYRNADGSLAEMCGNGVRVFVQALLDLGYIDLPPGESIAVGTRAGVKDVRRTDTGYAANLGPWSLIYKQEAEEQGSDVIVGINALEVPRPALSISMGNPHTVVALAQQSELDKADLREQPRVEPQPDNGTNVELVVPADPLVTNGTATITMRVSERGVGETQSCGTGACAAAAAVRYWAGEHAPNEWNVNVPGGQVQVRFLQTSESNRTGDGSEEVELAGPAEIVATGTIGAPSGS